MEIMHECSPVRGLFSECLLFRQNNWGFIRDYVMRETGLFRGKKMSTTCFPFVKRLCNTLWNMCICSATNCKENQNFKMSCFAISFRVMKVLPTWKGHVCVYTEKTESSRIFFINLFCIKKNFALRNLLKDFVSLV